MRHKTTFTVSAVAVLLFALTSALSVAQKPLANGGPAGPSAGVTAADAQSVTQVSNDASLKLSNGVETQRTYRNLYYFNQTTYAIQITYTNAYYTSALVQTGPGNPVTLTAGLEYNGTTIPVTWNGQRSVSVPDGGVVVSDVVPMVIPPGAAAYVRHALKATTGKKWVIGYSNGGTASSYSNDLSDLSTGTGALANSGNGNDVSMVSGITGITSPLSSGSIYIAGDSIAAGGHDYIVPNPPVSNASGFIARGLGISSTPVPYSWVFTPVAGTTLAERLTTTAPSLQQQIAGNKYAIVQLGINDVASSPVSELEANYLQYWNMLATAGLKVFQTTLTPRTTSTDGWRTAAGQTPTSTSGAIVTASNTTPIAIATQFPHYLATGQTLVVVGCAGNTAANGTWTVTVTGPNTLTLNRSKGNGVYAANSGTALNGEANRVAINNWIRTVPGPLSGIIEVANTVEVNASNAPTKNGGLWKVPSSADLTSTATGGTAGSISDSTQSWTKDQWQNYNVIVTSGKAAGLSALIYSNSATTLTTSNFAIVPAAGNTYVIQHTGTIDGIHPNPILNKAMAVPVTNWAKAQVNAKTPQERD